MREFWTWLLIACRYRGRLAPPRRRLTPGPPPGATVQVITTTGFAPGFVPPSASLEPPPEAPDA